MSEKKMRIRFWGVRGSTPTPGAETLRFGGNTSCVEIETPSGERLIFDAGSGIRGLGAKLVADANGAHGNQTAIQANIFLTHFHWDHIQGIPFFAPIYGAKNSITFHAGPGPALQEILEGQMVQPYFPVDFVQVAAQRHFKELKWDSVTTVGGADVRPFRLNHPQGASGYRIQCGESVVVYATDFEHGSDLDAILNDHAKGADILICDTQYTPQEYASHKGWGHSTWRHATGLAGRVTAKQLVLFHHDPAHNDHTMAGIQHEARHEFPETIAAWEGLTASL